MMFFNTNKNAELGNLSMLDDESYWISPEYGGGGFNYPIDYGGGGIFDEANPAAEPEPIIGSSGGIYDAATNTTTFHFGNNGVATAYNTNGWTGDNSPAVPVPTILPIVVTPPAATQTATQTATQAAAENKPDVNDSKVPENGQLIKGFDNKILMVGGLVVGILILTR